MDEQTKVSKDNFVEQTKYLESLEKKVDTLVELFIKQTSIQEKQISLQKEQTNLQEESIKLMQEKFVFPDCKTTGYCEDRFKLCCLRVNSRDKGCTVCE